MRTALECLGRVVIVFIIINLLILGQPYINNISPSILEPYSVYIIYVMVIILGIWIVNPYSDAVHGYIHKH